MNCMPCLLIMLEFQFVGLPISSTNLNLLVCQWFLLLWMQLCIFSVVFVPFDLSLVLCFSGLYQDGRWILSHFFDCVKQHLLF